MKVTLHLTDDQLADITLLELRDLLAAFHLDDFTTDEDIKAVERVISFYEVEGV